MLVGAKKHAPKKNDIYYIFEGGKNSCAIHAAIHAALRAALRAAIRAAIHAPKHFFHALDSGQHFFHAPMAIGLCLWAIAKSDWGLAAKWKGRDWHGKNLA